MVVGGFYGSSVFDPLMIVAQIIALQCAWYLALGLFLLMLRGGSAGGLTLFAFFDPHAVGGGKARASGLAWRTAFAFLLASASGAGLLTIIVERAKKCLDFATTLYLVHLVLVLCYAGWPMRFEWWLLQLACLATTAIGAEYLCLQREMRDIPLGGNRDGERRTAGNTGKTSPSVELQRLTGDTGGSSSSATSGTVRREGSVSQRL